MTSIVSQAFTSSESALNTTKYSSPLDARPSMPSVHYSSDGPSQSRAPFVPQTKFSGFCNVCKIKLNSYEQSKSHHEGKPHAKRVKLKKLEEEEIARRNADVNTDNSEKRAESGPPRKKQHLVPVTKLYCNACNLTFTSEAHAKDHYLGRNHARVLHGLAPYYPGYFNTSTSKWQRTPPDPRVSAQLLDSEPPADMMGKAPHLEKPKIRGKFHCELCNISLTCQEQLDLHLAGSRHAKNIRKTETNLLIDGMSSGDPNAKGIRCERCDVTVNSRQQFESHLESKKHKNRAKRTAVAPDPGQRHCDVCDIYVNSESQYQAHVQSNKHKSMVKAINRQNNATTEPQPQEASFSEPIEGDPFDPNSKINEFI